jgi:hypothetical protein
MYLIFVKINLIIFEVISLLILVSLFGALFYYAVIFKNLNTMKDEDNIGILDVKFAANFSKGVFSDIDLKLYHPNEAINQQTLNASILYNIKEYEDYNNDKEKINKISDDEPNNIFLFENQKLADNFKHRLLNLKTEASTFNLTLFTLISLFLIFMKITLLKESISRLRKIKSSKSDGKNEVYTNLLAQIHPEEFALSQGKEEQKNLYYNPVLSFLNPINVYYYIIFNLTIVIIIPLIYPSYVEYNVMSYIGFMSNMYNSVYYGRSYFGNSRLKNKDPVDLSKLIIPQDADSQKKLFMVHKYLDLTDYKPTNTNPYMVNLLIMCGSIWLSQLFKPFNSQTAVKIVDVDLKKGKLKILMKIGSIIAVFCIWGYFIIYGLIYLFDLVYLYHGLLFRNFKRILDIKIPLLILTFYYYIYFYVLMGIYTYQTYAKNKRYVGNQRIEYSWFS